jgi:hypothetical protein
MRKNAWVLAALCAIAGCGTEATQETKSAAAGSEGAAIAKTGPNEAAPLSTTATATDGKETPAVVDNPEIAKVVLTSDELAEIKKLSEANDQKTATDQKVCPVSWEPGTADEGHLGAMGAPIKRVVNGQVVFLCCKGCIKNLESDPAKYLAKLKK